MEDKLVLLNTLAREAGIKPHTARAAARAGWLKATRIRTEIGHIWKATRRDFQAWLDDPDAHRKFGKP